MFINVIMNVGIFDLMIFSFLAPHFFLLSYKNVTPNLYCFQKTKNLYYDVSLFSHLSLCTLFFLLFEIADICRVIYRYKRVTNPEITFPSNEWEVGFRLMDPIVHLYQLFQLCFMHFAQWQQIQLETHFKPSPSKVWM